MFKRAGEGANNMNLEQPNFDTPESIKSTAAATLVADKTGHTNDIGTGIYELREIAAEKISSQNNVPCMAKNVVTTAGETGALNIATQSPVKDGEMVISNDPGVIITSSTVFNSAGIGYVQTSHTTSKENIREAITRMAKIIG
jgi:aspartate/methionine/tyrosine aminotransferase